MDPVDHTREFKYNHVLMKNIQYDPNNEIKISVSKNDKLPALTLAGLNE